MDFVLNLLICTAHVYVSPVIRSASAAGCVRCVSTVCVSRHLFFFWRHIKPLLYFVTTPSIGPLPNRFVFVTSWSIGPSVAISPNASHYLVSHWPGTESSDPLLCVRLFISLCMRLLCWWRWVWMVVFFLHIWRVSTCSGLCFLWSYSSSQS